ncbi:MAG: hypothetical protein EOP58_05135 [Sphingomonadales bacterium]|nr:MAG: hypothetical protein EOP58_05135 [Sphingomonadales bacterium]
MGQMRLEGALVENAANLFSPREVAPDMEMPTIGFDQAIQLLGLHQRRLRGLGKWPGRTPRDVPFNEVEASILRKIEAIERHDAAEAARDVAARARASDRAGRVARRPR